MKSKTTIIGVISGTIIAGLIVAKLFKLIETDDFVLISGTVTGFAVTLIGIYSQAEEKKS